MNNLIHIVASQDDVPGRTRIWGTGGWISPEKREALDWLTLSRLLGWGVKITNQGDNPGEDNLFEKNIRFLIIACNPENIKKEFVNFLFSLLNRRPLLVVVRAAGATSPMSRLAGVKKGSNKVESKYLNWVGPGKTRQWSCRNSLESNVVEPLGDIDTWGKLGDNPIIAARRIGLGTVATLGFHPSHLRDTDGSATSLLKHLLIYGSPAPVAWFVLENSMVLRMDDPGSAESVYHRNYAYQKLRKKSWISIGKELRKRNARMTVAYVSGWIDDGDNARGTLKVGGRETARVAGKIHPSPLVKYHDHAGHLPGTIHDYESEFDGIQMLREEGLAEVELHGFTHMHPDTVLWAHSKDRYDEISWYRELGIPARDTISARPIEEHPLVLGISAIQRYFRVTPTSLICPGDDWVTEILECALNLNLQLVCSYYLALRYGDRFCWTTHICSPYLDEPDSAWLDSELPIVGCFHDRDIVKNGVSWLCEWLDRWQRLGVKKLMDLRELASISGRSVYLIEEKEGLTLRVESNGAPPLVRPLEVKIKTTEYPVPTSLPVIIDDLEFLLEVEFLDKNLAKVCIPLSHESGAERMGKT